MTVGDQLAFVNLDVTIIKGRDLVPKDRHAITRKKNISDPFVEVYYCGNLIGKTKVVGKTLNPTFDETFKIKLGANEARKIFDGESDDAPEGYVEMHIWDEDTITSNDPMGMVKVMLRSVMTQEPSGNWYPVENGPEGAKHYCHNACGDLEVKITAKGKKMQNAVRGNTQKIVNGTIRVGLGWELENGQAIDLDTSCVALDKSGNVLMEETVYYGNLHNSNSSIRHSGDEQEGDENIDNSGDDEVIMCDLKSVPKPVIALFFVLTVATPNKTLRDVKSAIVRVINTKDGKGLFNCVPSLKGESTSMFLFRIARDESKKGWEMTVIDGAKPAGRDFGTLIPEIKGYSRDLVPWIKVDPDERIAVMRKAGAIRVSEYSSGSRQSVPDKLTFGLAWDVTDGVNIDLDASAICLDANLNQVDLVFFKHLTSNDGAIVHSGDEREGDEKGDDETFTMDLNHVDPSITIIGFVVCSYSGQELDDVAGASCHLYDAVKGADVAMYNLTNAQELDKHTALLVSALYREEGGWVLRVIAEPAQGKVAHQLVSALQNFVRNNPPVAPSAVPDEDIEIEVMPEAVPIEDESKIQALHKIAAA